MILFLVSIITVWVRFVVLYDGYMDLYSVMISIVNRLGRLEYGQVRALLVVGHTSGPYRVLLFATSDLSVHRNANITAT